MSLDTFVACVRGYEDRLQDQQIIGVQTGHWAGYFTRAKKPKSLAVVVQNIIRSKEKEENKNKPKPQVDVAAFEALEERRMSATKN